MKRLDKAATKNKHDLKKGELNRLNEELRSSPTQPPSPVPEFTRAVSSLSPVSLGRKFRQTDVKRQDIDRISIAPLRQRQLSSRFVGSSHEELKALPLLVETSISERETLVLNKLRMCLTLFDFTDITIQLKSKEIKRLTLLELAEYISMNSSTITEPIYVGIINVFKVNCFRTINNSIDINDYLDNDADDEEMTNAEPSWPHLQLVYDLFLRFVSSPDFQTTLGKKYFDTQFLTNLLELFKSEDPREREFVKMILHRVYGKMVTLRQFIRKLIHNVFLRFIYEEDGYCGIAELLEILGSIINGFQTPLKDEHKQFLKRVLLPLHKTRCLNRFHAQITYCLTEFIKKDQNLLKMVVEDGLLRYWPKVNSMKEVLFLNELEACFECAGPIEFQSIISSVFHRLALCIESLHFQVSERALMIWNNEYLLSLMSENIELVLPIIFPALAKSRTHWNKTVHGLICNVLNWAVETDQKLVEYCSNKLLEDEQKKNLNLQKHQLYWARVDEAAALAQKSRQNNISSSVRARTPSVNVYLTGGKNKNSTVYPNKLTNPSDLLQKSFTNSGGLKLSDTNSPAFLKKQKDDKLKGTGQSEISSKATEVKDNKDRLLASKPKYPNELLDNETDLNIRTGPSNLTFYTNSQKSSAISSELFDLNNKGTPIMQNITLSNPEILIPNQSMRAIDNLSTISRMPSTTINTTSSIKMISPKSSFIGSQPKRKISTDSSQKNLLTRRISSPTIYQPSRSPAPSAVQSRAKSNIVTTQLTNATTISNNKSTNLKRSTTVKSLNETDSSQAYTSKHKF